MSAGGLAYREYERALAEQGARGFVGKILSARETGHYSVARGISMASKEGQRSFEREVSDELARQLGRQVADDKRLLVPSELIFTRDLTVANASAGGYLVET